MNQPTLRFEVKLASLIMLLVFISLLVFYESTKNSFVWDSTHYLFTYEEYFSQLTLENLGWMLTSFEFYNWHPLTWFSWAIDYQLYGGLNPWGFHFSNGVLHAINGALVFVLILMVLGLVAPTAERFTIRKDNDALIAAFFASLLFVVHPQHVESVAWVAERKGLLCQFFLLISLITYIKYVACGRDSKARWYALALISFVLAALSKPMAVSFPVVLLIIDVYPLRRSTLANTVLGSIQQKSISGLLVEKIPFLFVSAAIVLMTLVAQGSAIGTVVDYPLIARLINAIHSTVLYLEKFLIPLWLSPHYSYFQIMGTATALKALLIFSIFSGITVAALMMWYRGKRAWLASWVFYLVALLPVLGLIQVGSQGAADRYAYFPTLPVYILIAGGIVTALQSWGNRKRALLLGAAVIVIGFSAVQTRKQVHVWQSEISLWTHVVKLNPDNKFAHINLGILYKNVADYEHAALEFEMAGEGAGVPDSTYAWRAAVYMHLGRFRESIYYLVKLGGIAEIKPELKVDTDCIQYNIGWNFAQLDMYPEATEILMRVSEGSALKPDANRWLDALKENENQDGDSIVKQELPGICENLIPSRARDQRIR